MSGAFKRLNTRLLTLLALIAGRLIVGATR